VEGVGKREGGGVGQTRFFLGVLSVRKIAASVAIPRRHT